MEARQHKNDLHDTKGFSMDHQEKDDNEENYSEKSAEVKETEDEQEFIAPDEAKIFRQHKIPLRQHKMEARQHKNDLHNTKGFLWIIKIRMKMKKMIQKIQLKSKKLKMNKNLWLQVK